MKIDRATFDAVVADSKLATPFEGCGLLAANTDGVAVRFFPLTNVYESPFEGYAFDEEEQFEAFESAKVEGLKICAVYHSHPRVGVTPNRSDVGGAYDLVNLVLDPYDAAAWRGMTPEPIEVI